MIRYLLDTNVCIDLLRGRSPVLESHVRQFLPGDLGLSSITVYELAHGARRSSDPARNEAALAVFYLPLVLLPFDATAATIAGQVHAHLEQAGTPIGANDLLIAGHALALGVPLVTRNVREFRRVPGLQVEQWSS